MNAIAKFYTWFWIIYFPVCVAFCNAINFDWSDEILAALLIIYAFIHNRKLVKDRKRTNEIYIYIGIMCFYIIYSLILQVTTSKGVFMDVLQQIRPYVVFYGTWLMAPNFSQKQKKLVLFVMILSFLGYTYLNLAGTQGFGYALDGGESVQMGQIALSCSMLYVLFTKKSKRNLYIAIFITLVGLLGGKSKYIGECIGFIALVLFVHKKVRFNSAKVYFQVIALGVVIIFFTWTKFNAYYVEGMQRDEGDEMARPATYLTGLQIMVDYFPFGSGLGSFGCKAARDEYSPLYYKYHLDKIWGLAPENPMFLADTFYPIVYSEYGLVGVFLFLAFWKRRLKETNRIVDVNYYKMALMCILALALEQTADSSYLSGKGMGYFMILAVCLNSNRYLRVDEDEKENDETNLVFVKRKRGLIGLGHNFKLSNMRKGNPVSIETKGV